MQQNNKIASYNIVIHHDDNKESVDIFLKRLKEQLTFLNITHREAISFDYNSKDSHVTTQTTLKGIFIPKADASENENTKLSHIQRNKLEQAARNAAAGLENLFLVCGEIISPTKHEVHPFG